MGGAVLATPKDFRAPFWTTSKSFGASVALLVPPHSDPASSLPPQDPMEIYVDDSKLTLHGLQQHYVKLAENEKNRKLNELLDALEFNQVVIFVKSVQRAIQLDKLLQECNFPSVAIHARIEQAERIELYQSFKDFKHRILVSTDIWGRASTSSVSTSSSTTTCPRCRTPTCTASAAPAASAPRASPSPSFPTTRMPRPSRTCSLVSRCPSRSCPRRSTSAPT